MTHCKILVVDDDDMVRAVAVRQLTSLGYGVVEASNGTAALDVLASVPDIRLLFVDMVMPGGLGGPEVAQEARRLYPDLKILFASGYVDGPALDADALVKPYRKQQLAAKVQEVLGIATS